MPSSWLIGLRSPWLQCTEYFGSIYPKNHTCSPRREVMPALSVFPRDIAFQFVEITMRIVVHPLSVDFPKSHSFCFPNSSFFSNAECKINYENMRSIGSVYHKVHPWQWCNQRWAPDACKNLKVCFPLIQQRLLFITCWMASGDSKALAKGSVVGLLFITRLRLFHTRIRIRDVLPWLLSSHHPQRMGSSMTALVERGKIFLSAYKCMFLSFANLQVKVISFCVICCVHLLRNTGSFLCSVFHYFQSHSWF